MAEDFGTVYDYLAAQATPETHGPAVDAFNAFGRLMQTRSDLLVACEAMLAHRGISMPLRSREYLATIIAKARGR